MTQEPQNLYREVYYNGIRTDGLHEARHITLPCAMSEHDGIFFVINDNDDIAYYNEFLVL